MSAQFDAYLFFTGTCAEAMRFYEKTLGGKIEMMMTHGEMPAAPGMPPPTPESEHLVMHSRLVVEGRGLMASDWIAPVPFPGMHGVAISLNYADAGRARSIFAALSEGGHVTMPLQPTFWIEAFGMVTDRFGTPWMINGGAPAPPSS